MKKDKDTSWRMSRVKQKNTAPEMIVRKYLFSKGIRYRLHLRNLPGVPDLAIPRKKLAIFIHGCFWHGHEGCKRATLPKTNLEFWQIKLEYNKTKDMRHMDDLAQLGWTVITVWECELKRDIQNLTLERVLKEILNHE